MSDVAFGVRVALHDRCLNCGCSTAFVGKGPAPLYRQLLCDGCECGRGYVSKELRDHLEKFVGEPNGYLVLRTGKVLRPGSVGVDAANATELKPKPRTARRHKTIAPGRARSIQGMRPGGAVRHGPGRACAADRQAAGSGTGPAARAPGNVPGVLEVE